MTVIDEGAQPATVQLTDAPGAEPIDRVRWATHIPAVRVVGPGNTLVVELRAGAHTGYGYAHVWHDAPLPVAADLGVVCSTGLAGTTPGAWATTSRPAIEAGPLRAIGWRGLSGVVLSALDLAMWDLGCKQRGVALQELLGQTGSADGYSTEGLDPLVGAAEAGRAAERLVDAGFTIVKLYCKGQDPAAERERIATVRAAIGPERTLFIDAGSAYTTESARWLLDLAADYGAAFVEDPVDKADFAGLAWLAERSPVPLAGGQETAAPDLARLLDAVELDTVLIDLQQAVGISGWLEALAVAERHGARVSGHAYTHVCARLLAGGRADRRLVQHAPWDEDIFGETPVVDGRVVPLEAPGATADPRIDLDWRQVTGDA